jgi:formate hydrogenlyase subunit 3/multisubunit Na+/H+ antiporter MnhD subunit
VVSGLLIGLAVVVGALLALGPVAWLGGPWLSSRGTLLLCGIGAALDLAALLGGAAPEPIEIPIGLPGSGILFALDGLSALFLLLLFVAGAAAAAAAMGEADERPGAPFLPVLIGAAAATVLAADGFSVVLAWQAAALTLAALAIGGDRRGRAAARVLGGGVASGLLLIAAMALLAPVQSWGLDLSFAGMRAHPPEGFRATAMFLLVLLGGGWAAGLAPLHGWLAPARAAMPAPAGAFLAGGSVGAYLLARVLLDLAGPAPPAWWGAVLLLCGAAGAVLGAARAVRAESIRIIPGAAAVARTGLVCVGLGLALAARAVDLAPLAALALGGAFLAIVTQALAGTLLALAAGAAEAGGGSRHLDRLGGLLRPMPVTAGCAMVAAASLAALPASLGFAAAWTLLQALIGIARVGGLGWQALSAVATLAVASAMVLGAVAAVRLLGIAFLGRPRTPRAAAAREAPLPARVSMLALAVPTVAAGVFPGAVLRLAAPASRLLLGADMSDRAGLLAIAPVPEAPGLAAAALAALLALTTLVTLRLLRLRAAVGHRTGAVWEGGAPPPPPWLPFGDPATQVGAAGFADPLGAMLDAAMPRRPAMARRMLRHWRSLAGWVEAAEGPSAQAGLAALFVALALLLLALALAAPA